MDIKNQSSKIEQLTARPGLKRLWIVGVSVEGGEDCDLDGVNAASARQQAFMGITVPQHIQPYPGDCVAK